ncbi:U2 small nuclear ribonucleoprotein A' [Glugoides intestinalis]
MADTTEMSDQPEILLNKTGIKVLPEIGEKVRILEARRNRLENIKLPTNSELETIDVSDNLIKEMDAFNDLNRLKVLDVGYNLIKRIPELRLPALQELYVMSNDISSISGLSLPTLLKLDVANNDLKELKDLGCPKLLEAYFGANRIREIEGFTKLSTLEILDLQYNCFEEIDCLQLPKSLKYLFLNNNMNLTKVKNIEHLEELKVLGLKNTKVEIDSKWKFDFW